MKHNFIGGDQVLAALIFFLRSSLQSQGNPAIQYSQDRGRQTISEALRLGGTRTDQAQVGVLYTVCTYPLLDKDLPLTQSMYF